MSDFPNEIDLGHKLDLMTNSISDGKKGKPKVFYPTLYISGVKGLEDLPEEGEALIHFKRRRLSTSTTDSGEEHSADLEITKLCLPDEGADDEYDESELTDGMSEFAKEKGVDTGEEDSADEETE